MGRGREGGGRGLTCKKKRRRGKGRRGPQGANPDTWTKEPTSKSSQWLKTWDHLSKY